MEYNVLRSNNMKYVPRALTIVTILVAHMRFFLALYNFPSETERFFWKRRNSEPKPEMIMKSQSRKESKVKFNSCCTCLRKWSQNYRWFYLVKTLSRKAVGSTARIVVEETDSLHCRSWASFGEIVCHADCWVHIKVTTKQQFWMNSVNKIPRFFWKDCFVKLLLTVCE